MPNNVMNEIVFSNIGDDLRREIIANVSGEREIDFETLLPPPLNSWPGSVSSKHEAIFPQTHLDWATANWGTKWNAYGLNQGGKYQSVEQTDGGLILRFQTAWSPPMGWLCAIFNRFKGSFDYHWLDEGRERARTGFFNYAALEKMGGWDEWESDDATHRRMHKLLWGVEEFEPEPEEAEGLDAERGTGAQAVIGRSTP